MEEPCRAPRLHPTDSPLDIHVGMFYRVLRRPACSACIPWPRSRSFVVVELHGLQASAEGGYCVYVTCKRGLSSHEAGFILARLLGVKTQHVALLGLKDADATTVQAVCMPCPANPPKHLSYRSVLWARLAGRVSRCPRPGQLQGNSFTILLRPVGCTADELANLLLDASKSVLPAYYSYQRFGTRRPNTHVVAALLVAGRHREAYEELLGNPYPDEALETIMCRLGMWRSPNCRKPWAYESQLANIQPERIIDRLPTHIARMLSSALQAYIFNLYISERIRRGYSLCSRVKGERLASDGRPLAYVPGVGYKLGVSGEARAVLKEALELAGLTEEELAKAPAKLKSKPYWRPVYTKPINLRVETLGDKLVLRFAMEKGMYATLLLREVINYPDETCDTLRGQRINS